MADHRPPAVIGLVAHVDAGKTTLSEELLYVSGALRRKGRVDHGDAFLDTDVQEKERGITIFSKQARISFRGRPLILLDTPGHVDFSGETERAIGVMDAAVMVISATDGVQSHTRTLWKLLKSADVPVFIFVNKMDQPGADRKRLVGELRTQLSPGCTALEEPDAAEDLALTDEKALEELLETGRIDDATVSRLVAERKVFPVYFGAALRGDGVEALLDGLDRLLPERRYPEAFSARVYKIARDASGARLTFVRITGGKLRVRDLLPGVNGEPGEKVSQIRLYSGAKYEPADEAPAGELAALLGPAHTAAGQTWGVGGHHTAPAMTPVLRYRVRLAPGTDEQRALRCFRELEEEDPELQITWIAQLRRIQVGIMGEVQLEILSRQLHDRYQLDVEFVEGGVLYRETIAAPVDGAGHYEPLRHYAEVHLRLEPGPRGSGVTAASECMLDDLALNWQRLIMTHILERVHTGVLVGAPLTDVKIVLTAGRAHLKHTEGGDFRQATYRAIRQGLMQAENVLLEPWYHIRLEVPNDCVGRALNDLNQMGGSAEIADSDSRLTVIDGQAPVARARHYARQVAMYTHGEGRVALENAGYQPCADQAVLVEASGYDPERDVDNPADSVFCSHGAGVVIPWREASRYMHLQNGTESGTDADQPESEAPVRAAPPRDSLEEDKELLRIFERTYGPIKPRSILLRKPDASLPERVTIPEAPDEYLLVDGYNIIFAWDELKELAGFSLDMARDQLIDLMCDFNGVRNLKLILVFDAYRVAGGRGSVEKRGNVDIVYTKEAETADAYIVKAAYELRDKRRVRVATSDGMEQLIILASGALRISAREFRHEIEQTEGELMDYLARNALKANGNPVSDALRAAMEKLKNKES